MPSIEEVKSTSDAIQTEKKDTTVEKKDAFLGPR